MLLEWIHSLSVLPSLCFGDFSSKQILALEDDVISMVSLQARNRFSSNLVRTFILKTHHARYESLPSLSVSDKSNLRFILDNGC